MTPVQASTIPLFSGNKDVVVEAVTGSGKTLAFLLPTTTRLLTAARRKHHINAVIISPTRELASQIFDVLQSLLAFQDVSAGENISAQLLLGGTSDAKEDLKAFLALSPHILVGTPGRLLELLSSRYVHARADTFEVLVLDEADRLLDLGFKDTLTGIISRLPKQRRTGLFSASVTDAVVGGLVRSGLRNPVKVAVKVHVQDIQKRTPASLEMKYLLATPSERLAHVQRMLPAHDPQKAILYVSTCACVDYFSAILPAVIRRYSILPLHGKQTPAQRKKNFSAFVTSTAPVMLLTTDLAARGLDVPAVDLVLQLDAPTDPKVFLHRCGRAGRAGRPGLAILFLTPGREESYIPFLSVRKTPVSLYAPQYPPPTPTETQQLTARLREKVLTDRALHDKATRAFVSHVRAYTTHVAASIFRVRDLPWRELVEGFALVRVPRVPEMAGVVVDVGDVDVCFLFFFSPFLPSLPPPTLFFFILCF
jgi:ATP-dependent RNA helicase DDX55/SPB4